MAKSDKPGAGKGAATRMVHAGRRPFDHHGFINPPLYRGSTVLYPDTASLTGKPPPYVYGRRGTPTMAALEEAIGELDGAAGCVISPSGLGAITAAILAYARAGDHVLVTDSVYRPTRHFCDSVLARLGIETEYYDPLMGGAIKALLKPNTRLVYTESPGSQTMEVQDIPAIAAAAHDHGALVLCDNTWGTPLYFAAIGKGVDVVIHAATKYITGHSDAMLGAISANDAAWPALRDTWQALGNCAGTEEIYIGLRGLRTMAVRLERQMAAGIEIAGWLRGRAEVAEVLHPALAGAPGHELWKRDFSGACGLFSIVLKPVAQKKVHAMLDSLALFGLGYSWGGYESLIIPFDPSQYRTATQWSAKGPALRLHVGLEDVADLKADLARGLEKLRS